MGLWVGLWAALREGGQQAAQAVGQQEGLEGLEGHLSPRGAM